MTTYTENSQVAQTFHAFNNAMQNGSGMTPSQFIAYKHNEEDQLQDTIKRYGAKTGGLATIAAAFGVSKTDMFQKPLADLTQEVSMRFNQTDWSLQAYSTTSNTNAGSQFLQAVILEVVNLSLKDVIYQNTLISQTINVPYGKSVVIPTMTIDGVAGVVGEGASFPRMTTTFGESSYRPKKWGIEVEITYELLEKTSMQFLNMILDEGMKKVGRGIFMESYNKFLNGDGLVSSAIEAVGMETGTLTYEDLTMAIAAGSVFQYNFMSWLMNLKSHNKMSKLPELKALSGKEVLLPYDLVNITDPRAARPSVTVFDKLPNDMILMYDKRYALTRLVHKGLMVESMQNTTNQTHVYTISTTMGFIPPRHDSRIALILDESISALPYTGTCFDTVAYAEAVYNQITAGGF